MAVSVPHTFRTAGARTPLHRLDENFAALAGWINGRLIDVGPLASRPVPGHPGRLYVATEFDSWYLDDGTQWQAVGGMGDGGLVVSPTTGTLNLFGASGATGTRGIVGAVGTAPTTSPADVAQAWVMPIQGEAGRAGWVTRSEAGAICPVDPVLFRRVGHSSGFMAVTDTTFTTLGSWPLLPGTLQHYALEIALRYDVSTATVGDWALGLYVLLNGTWLAQSVLHLSLTVSQGLWVCEIHGLTDTAQIAAHHYGACWPANPTIDFNTTVGAFDATTALTLSVAAQWGYPGSTLNATALTVRAI